MHELSIALSIIELVQEEAARREDVNVRAIHVRLGVLSGVVKAALLSSYELARENTSLASCRLIIEEVPLVAFCSSCASPRPVASVQAFRCPVCGTPATDIVSGKELEISALELDE